MRIDPSTLKHDQPGVAKRPNVLIRPPAGGNQIG
jgi:hypothetical protein